MGQVICAECGKVVDEDEAGICQFCEEVVCGDCQVNYDQFSQIDFPLHKMCDTRDQGGA